MTAPPGCGVPGRAPLNHSGGVHDPRGTEEPDRDVQGGLRRGRCGPWQGIGPEERDWRPAPGEWSAREVVHHLADSGSDLRCPAPAAPHRGQPGSQGYDGAEYARRLPLSGPPVGARPPRYEAARATTVQAPRVHDGRGLAPHRHASEAVRTLPRSGSASARTTASFTPSRSGRTGRAGPLAALTVSAARPRRARSSGNHA